MADGKPMTFIAHLNELRTRIIVSVIAILVATLAAFFAADTILNVLLLPSGGLHLRAFRLVAGFMIKFKVAFYAGIIISMPVWAYEIISFVGPGLKPSEKSLLIPLLVASVVLFAAGTGFGYYLLSDMIRVFIKMFPPRIEYLPSAQDYLSFTIFFLLSCGLAFQLPCALLALVGLRLLSSSLLRKQRRIAYFILFVFAEIITPVSDPIVAPLIVMLPLVVLYELTIVLSRRIEGKRVIPGGEPAGNPA